MDPRTKENGHLRTALAESWDECGSMTKTIVSLEERLDAVQQERDDVKRRHGEEMCERDDVIAEQKKTIASLEHRLAMRSNADSPSGIDPIEYESNKQFHNAVEAHEAAKENGEQPPESVTPKQCGGQPGHPGKSHDIKPDGLKIYTAELVGTPPGDRSSIHTLAAGGQTEHDGQEVAVEYGRESPHHTPDVQSSNQHGRDMPRTQLDT